MNKRLLVACMLLFTLWQDLALAQVDFREETIYFLMTTRFFDGDPSNNAPTEWCSYNPDPNINPEITDPNDVTWRGDFKGLIEKLGYIQDMGFTAIWITPIVQNRGPLDYHGYHAYDFTKVDPRLESPGATFQDLINAVHARGMKIVLDVVTNHSGRFGVKGHAEIKYNTDPTQPWGQDSNGDPLQPNPNWEYDGLTPNPDDGLIWSRADIPPMPAPYNENLAAYNWPGKESYVDTSDPNWYHHSGNGFAQGYDDTENLYNRALAGDTPDFNTSSQVVRDYLVAAYTTFINMGVDAFRWDTIKHMSKEDVIYFFDAFKAVNPDLFIFGEVAQKRHELHQVEEINPHWYTWRGAVNNSAPLEMAVIDFYAQSSFHNAFEYGGSFAGAKAAARYDHLYSDPSTNLLWLDNHDFGPNNDWNKRYGGSDENLAACLNFMFTWRGIPIVYYGTEMRFKAGAYADIKSSEDTRKSIDNTGRAYYGDVMNQAPSHRIYQHIKKLNAIRAAVPALQKGSWRWDGTGDGNGVGFVRKHGDSEVAVALAKDGAVTFNFSGLTNGTYADAVTGEMFQVSNGTLTCTVQPASAKIFVLNGPGMIGGNGVGFFEAGTGGVTLPVATISPASTFSENPVNVSISAALGAGAPYTVYYTTNGSEPSTSSAVYTGQFTVSETTTVKALAVDADGNNSFVVSATYTIGELPSMTVYFKKPADWGQANIHHWGAQTVGVVADTNWPGETMQQEGSSAWYSYQLTASSSHLLFVDGTDADNAARKTADQLNISGGWFDGANWTADCPSDCPAPPVPVVSLSPAGGNFQSGSVEITLSATEGGSIVYTTDGSDPATNGSAYTAPFTLSGNDGDAATVIRAIATNANGTSAEVTGSYTFNTPVAGAGMTVHFLKPAEWTTVNVHHWEATPANILDNSVWPGPEATSEGNGWYSYTFADIDFTNLMFNDAGSGSAQTPATSRTGDGWFMDGTWFDACPAGCPGTTPLASPTISPEGGTYALSVEITLSADAGSAIHYTTDGSTPTASSPLYTGAFTLTDDATIKAIAVANGTASFLSEESYIIYSAVNNTGVADGGEVLLQGYHWNSTNPDAPNWWANLSGKVTDMAEAGFDGVWLPPMSDSGDDHGYHPRRWYNLNNGYGSEQELRDLIAAFHANGMKAIGDIVINHRVGTTDWGDFTEPSLGGCSSVTGDDEWPESCGNGDTGTPYGPARDLDHTNETVRTEIINWMNWLKNDVGFDGWRYDYVHGFSPGYFATYNNATTPWLSIGENWKPTQEIIDWIDGTNATSTAFDFPLKYALHDAVNGNYGALKNGNNMPGVAGVWKKKAVTFLENHDTEAVRANGNQFPNDPNTNTQLLQGYAYILTHPGMPTVFYPHYFSFGTGLQTAIKEMIAARKAAGVHRESTFNIDFGFGSGYAAYIDGRNGTIAMKIGGGDWSPNGTGWTLASSGNGYAIWTNAVVSNQAPVVSISPDGGYDAASIEVTLSATDDTDANPSIYYTLDGSEPDNTKTLYTAAFTITSTTTVKAIAYDSEGQASAVVSRTFTIGELPTFSVYFKKPADWGQANIHHWNALPAGAANDTSWPGAQMADAGNGWFRYNFTALSTQLLFVDGTDAAPQTADLFRDRDGWFVIGQGWSDTCPGDCPSNQPELTVAPASGNFPGGSVEVTLTATNGGAIYYTLDGSDPTANSTAYTAPFTLSGNHDDPAVELKAIAYNSEGASEMMVASYTFNQVADMTVYFKPSGYANPTIYFWNPTPANGLSTTWPGEAMTDAGSGWYAYTFAQTECINLIFSNNGASQTADLYRCGTGYYVDGTWADGVPQELQVVTPPDVPQNLTVALVGVEGTEETSGYYYIQVNWEDVADEDGYELQRSTSEDFSTDLQTFTLGANVTEYQDNGPFAPVTQYFYRVRAFKN